jgi:hypothetical protein
LQTFHRNISANCADFWGFAAENVKGWHYVRVVGGKKPRGVARLSIFVAERV